MRMVKLGIGVAVLAVVAAIAVPIARDELAWRSAQGNSDAGYESYIRSWPTGRHAGDARAALDEAAWRAASQSTDRLLTERYLQSFPSGGHVAEARLRLESLEWEVARTAGRASAFESYLAKHPDGQHVNEAKTALAEARARVNTQDSEKLTPLMRAAAKGERSTVADLLADGADPNVPSREQGVTALMFAAYFGHAEVVNLLLEKGAAVNAKDSGGDGPIDWAAVGGHKDIAKQFADRGARLKPSQGGALGAFLAVGGMPLWFMDKAKK